MSAARLFNAMFGAGLVTILLTLVRSLGMTFSAKQILEPLRRVWLVAGTRRGSTPGTSPAGSTRSPGSTR
jgi:hypothetical protein